MSPFLFVKLVQQRRTQNHAKPVHRVRRSSGQPFIGTTRSAGVGGFGLALVILVGLAKNSDIGRVGKKMVLRHIPIYFLSTILHDIKPKLASFSSHSFWTSSSLDAPAGVTQEEGHTGFFIHLLSAVRALFFLARRIQPFLFLVDREVEFCVLTI